MALNIKIKVVGVGGSGGNAINRIKKYGLPAVDLITINTDAQDLAKKNADFKLRIGMSVTRGLGAGANPKVGRRAAEEQREEIKKLLEKADIVFITTGLGGGTGSGAAPIVAQIVKELGILTIGVVTTPFSFEGQIRSDIAERAKKELEKEIDSLIIISNNNLLKVLGEGVSITKAFDECDKILYQAVKGISDLIVLPGIVNVNLADVRSIMKDSGTAFFGIGLAEGEDRAAKAAKEALSSPLLDIPIGEAKGILFNISGGPDISLHEINEAATVITQNTGKDTKVIFGAIQDEKLERGRIKVTVIATGF